MNSEPRLSFSLKLWPSEGKYLFSKNCRLGQRMSYLAEVLALTYLAILLITSYELESPLVSGDNIVNKSNTIPTLMIVIF